jgi:hypothetical protein
VIILELKADDGGHEKAGAYSVSVVFVGQLTPAVITCWLLLTPFTQTEGDRELRAR